MNINKYNKAMQFLLRPKYLRDDVIIQEDSNEPLVARAGFEEGTKLTDYVEANISGNTGSSTPGEGVKINNETFNAIVNLKIPYSDKLKLLGELGFGSNRTKVDLSEIGKKYGIDLGTETYKDKYSNYKVEGMEDPRYRQIGLAEGGRPIDTSADIAVEKSLFNPKQYGKVAKQIIKNPVVKQATKLITGEIGLGVPFALDDYVEGYTPKEVLLNVATIGFGTSIKDDLDMLNTIGPKKEKLLQQYASKSAERRLNQRKGKENIIDKDMQEALNARDEFYSKLAEKRAKLREQRLKTGEVESEARGLMGEAQMTEREGFAIGSISKATNWIDRDMNAIDVLIKTGRISRDQAFQDVGDLTFARQQGLSEAEFKSNNKQQEQKEPKKVNTYKKQPIQVNQASGLSIEDIMKKYG
jgi:hypothetical protein